MKKILLALLLNTICYSQSATINYNFKILEDKKILESPYIGKIFSEQIKAAKFLEFKLVFIDTISKFKSVQTMAMDKQNISSVLMASRCVKPKFTYNDTIFRNNSDGNFPENKYLVVEPINKNWVITNESKKIDNYTCYKATSEYIVINGKGEFHHPVIAWFCPELPYSFGPAGYGGLPGLILELQEWNNVFGAIKIEFKSLDEPIILPTKGIKISNQDYQNKVGEAFQKAFKD